MSDGTHDGTQAGSPGGVVRIGGRYELGELLGRGGMAEVRKGTDIRLGRTVAVKRLRTDLAADPTFQARFRREAQSAAGLNHPNIVSVYDTGEEMSPDGSHVQPYIVMEYVAGRTLRDVLNDGRKVLPERALEITSGILAALDYSHRAGIIHRDIKPANVMLTPSGEVKVMDFGIARAVADGTSTVTQTSAVVGTAQYLSPEQARGETVDTRSDVYSTGCLLYELLAGRPPFVGDSAFSVAYQHVREQPEPPSVHNPDLPPELDAIVMKALAKKVEDRYQSAADMRADLQRYLDGHSLDAGTMLVPPAPPVEDEPTSFFGTPVAGEDDAGEGRRKRRWQPILLALLVLALLAGAIAVGIQLFGGPTQVAVPKLTGLSVREAQARLQVKGLVIGQVHRENSDRLPKGRVLSQDPVADSTVDKGASVDLVVSAGTKQVVIKYVIGDTKQEAQDVLTGLGLNVAFRTVDSEQPKDTVIATDPNAGETVDAGSTVTVTLSSGPVKVPNVVGLSEDTARKKLEDAGFDVSVQKDKTTPSKKGTVLSQSPDGLTNAPRGSTVEITVSDYTSPTPTPTPTPSPSESSSGPPTPTPSVSTSGSASP